MDDDSHARQRLEEERARLAQVKETYAEEDEAEGGLEQASLEQHQADLGTDTFEREKDLSILENIEAELADVEHALRRIDDGSYGTCEACGRPIGADRLEVMPAARFCIDDQAANERQGRAGAST